VNLADRITEDPGAAFALTAGVCFAVLYALHLYVIVRLWQMGDRVRRLEVRE
jgi:hypothetical protein